MPNSGDNIRFQVLVNGVQRATAGLETVGVLSVIVGWVRRDPAAAPKGLLTSPGFQADDWVGNTIDVSLSGLDSKDGEHIDWFNSTLEVGDEVVVRILPPGEFDPPARRRSGCGVRPSKATRGSTAMRKATKPAKKNHQPDKGKGK